MKGGGTALRSTSTTSLLLSRVMRTIRAGAPSLPVDRRFSVRLDQACGETFAQVWFLTRGCSWDRSGSCTMCNYGHGPKVTDDVMVEAVADALETIKEPVGELFVSPSGSMLDPHEVPESARVRIMKLLAAFPAPKVCLETRAETITPGVVDHLVATLSGKRLTVELGLESSSPWIQQFCINRASRRGSFERAAGYLRRHGVRVAANISLGTAFLTAAEAIDDARRSIAWALENGADQVVVFPLHVKPYTLLSWLHDRGLYRPPSLWSLVEVLSRVAPRDLHRVIISWYRDDYGPADQPVFPPTTCRDCRERVLILLDRYRHRPSTEALTALAAEPCECKDEWREEVARAPDMSLGERVLRHYDVLAGEFGLVDWWAGQREHVRAELLESPL